VSNPSHSNSAATNESQVSKRLYLPGFDYLRVFFMVSVIAGHVNLITGLAAQRAGEIGQGPNFWDHFYVDLQSTAVPSFILISTLLFCVKPVTWESTLKRLTKLGYLYIFWVSAWIVHSKPMMKPGVLGLIELVLRGGGWLFYFISVLILMTLLTVGISALKGRWRLLGYAVSVGAFLATVLWVSHDHRWTQGQYYWVPTCFALLPCFALGLAPRLESLIEDRSARWRLAAGLLACGVVAALVEWHFAAPASLIEETRKWVPKHARFSISFDAAMIVVLSLGIRCKPGWIVSFLARNALGIYCLHGFIVGGVVKGVDLVVGGRFPALVLPLSIVATVCVCSMGAEFLRRAFRERLV
jgi:hypothetical protein